MDIMGFLFLEIFFLQRERAYLVLFFLFPATVRVFLEIFALFILLVFDLWPSVADLWSLTVPLQWCSATYYEFDRKVGETFQAAAEYPQIFVDGGMDTLDATRFCLGSLTNTDRVKEAEKCRSIALEIAGHFRVSGRNHSILLEYGEI